MKRLNLGLIFAFLVICFQAGFLSVHAAGVKWQSDIASAAAEAKSTNRFMLVAISAPWCPACRQLEKLMAGSMIGEWTNSRFVSVHLSADAPDGKALLQKFGMDGIPALLVFGPDGKFKDKMSGGPEDEEGFKHFLTQMAGGEAAFANAGSSGARVTGRADGAGGNSLLPAQMEQGFNAGTADGAYPQQNYLPPSQQNYQQPAQQSYQPPAQQLLQQGFQTPQQQNYLPPAQYSQGGYPQGRPQEQIPTGYSSAPPNGFAPQQYSPPVMQWQGQQPSTSAQYPLPQRQFQQQPGQYYQPGQYSQQFQQAPQQYPPGQTYPPPGRQFPQPGQQYPQPGQQYPQAEQRYPQPEQQFQPPTQ